MRRAPVTFLMSLVLCGTAAAEVILSRDDCLPQTQREEIRAGLETIMQTIEAERNERDDVALRDRYFLARMDAFSSQSALVKCQATTQKDEETIEGPCRKEREHYLTARSTLETAEAQVNSRGVDLMKRMNERLKALREKYPSCN